LALDDLKLHALDLVVEKAIERHLGRVGSTSVKTELVIQDEVKVVVLRRNGVVLSLPLELHEATWRRGVTY
jgi:hypothetical protein